MRCSFSVPVTRNDGVHAFRIECSQSARFYTDHMGIVATHQEDFLCAMFAGMCADAFNGHFLSCKAFGIGKKRINFQAEDADCSVVASDALFCCLLPHEVPIKVIATMAIAIVSFLFSLLLLRFI